ncbi:hypothetical protein LWI29_029537 [Acer saccharum]|uniref:F-box/LRR-repeat protein 15/At3g58940/PEG3-like LRR domain-containing protein n=1 Tax=Acer saccharum TaxID=4024 RepID=A0AA39W4C3_ACESA|nr:hypothetical protein LWI29_029537 [Acer saccharum]
MELPRCMVNCESLVDLKIYFDLYCVLKLPEFLGFTGLKSLNLCKVEFSDSVVLAMFVSGCPILESLIIYSCVFGNFKILDITAPRLRNLTINVLAFHGDGLNCEVIIACPSLVSFDPGYLLKTQTLYRMCYFTLILISLTLQSSKKVAIF